MGSAKRCRGERLGAPPAGSSQLPPARTFHPFAQDRKDGPARPECKEKKLTESLIRKRVFSLLEAHSIGFLNPVRAPFRAVRFSLPFRQWKPVNQLVPCCLMGSAKRCRGERLGAPPAGSSQLPPARAFHPFAQERKDGPARPECEEKKLTESLIRKRVFSLLEANSIEFFKFRQCLI